MNEKFIKRELGEIHKIIKDTKKAIDGSDWLQFTPEGFSNEYQSLYGWKLHVYGGARHESVKGDFYEQMGAQDMLNVLKVVTPLLLKKRACFKIPQSLGNEKIFTIYLGFNDYSNNDYKNFIRKLAKEIDGALVNAGLGIDKGDWIADNALVPGTNSGRLFYRRDRDEVGKYVLADKGSRFYNSAIDPFCDENSKDSYTVYVNIIHKSIINEECKIDREKTLRIKGDALLFLPFNENFKLLLHIFPYNENELDYDARFHLNWSKARVAHIGCNEERDAVLIQQFKPNKEKFELKSYKKLKDTETLKESILKDELSHLSRLESGIVSIEAMPGNNIKVTNKGKNAIYYKN